MRRVIGQHSGTACPPEREQCFKDKRVTVPCPGSGCSFDHRIFTGNLISKNRDFKPVFHTMNDI